MIVHDPITFLSLPFFTGWSVVGQAGVAGGDALSVGLSIAVAGLTIVFLALILITLFIASLPRALKYVAKIWPESVDRHSAEASGETHPESLVPEDAASLAAIGFVLHTEFQRQLVADQGSKGKK